jgi:hypothetical protein
MIGIQEEVALERDDGARNPQHGGAPCAGPARSDLLESERCGRHAPVGREPPGREILDRGVGKLDATEHVVRKGSSPLEVYEQLEGREGEVLRRVDHGHAGPIPASAKEASSFAVKAVPCVFALDEAEGSRHLGHDTVLEPPEQLLHLARARLRPGELQRSRAAEPALRPREPRARVLFIAFKELEHLVVEARRANQAV